MFKLPGPVDEWRETRQRIHTDVCAHGFDKLLALLSALMVQRNLTPASCCCRRSDFSCQIDPRIVSTVQAIERRLMVNGLVLRYDSATASDGLPAGEGVFLACSFWLADAYLMLGRRDDALRLFNHLLSLRNDVGLLSEEYEPRTGPSCRQFSAGFLASRAGQHREQPCPSPEARRTTCGRSACSILIRQITLKRLMSRICK